MNLTRELPGGPQMDPSSVAKTYQDFDTAENLVHRDDKVLTT